jgi:hypothetical protein
MGLLKRFYTLFSVSPHCIYILGCLPAQTNLHFQKKNFNISVTKKKYLKTYNAILTFFLKALNLVSECFAFPVQLFYAHIIIIILGMNAVGLHTFLGTCTDEVRDTIFPPEDEKTLHAQQFKECIQYDNEN